MARIKSLPPKDWPPEMRAALAAMRPAAATHPAPGREGRPKALNALGMLAYHPVLTEAFNTFNGHILFTSSLTPRQRELLVLRVAHVRGCEYEWAQHTVLARDAGLDVADIERVASGADAEGWSEPERALLRAVDELVEGAGLSDVTWASLNETLEVRQLLDLVFTVGAYDTLAMAFRSFGVELDADLSGHELVVAMGSEPDVPTRSTGAPR
jgi:AhpD family alkylhydroperoxidase